MYSTVWNSETQEHGLAEGLISLIHQVHGFGWCRNKGRRRCDWWQCRFVDQYHDSRV